MAAADARALDSVEISVSGEDQSLVEKLGAVSLTQAARTSGQTEPQDIMAAALADYSRLLGALYESGYYSAAISIKVDGKEAANISPFASIDTIRTIKITVDPGRVFSFSLARVAPLAQGTALPKDFKIGEIARSPLIQSAVGAAVDGWRDAGYAKAEPDRQRIIADHRKATLAADIGISTGPRVRFGTLRVSGNSSVRESRIKQIAGLPEGQVFSPEEVEKSATRLRRTGTFRSVALTEATDIREEDILDIDADILDAKKRRVGFGAEISSLDGLALSGFWMHRNLLGGAENLRIEAEAKGLGGETGGEDYSLSARFGRPATFGADTALYALAELEVLDEPDYQSEQITLAFGATRILSDTLQVEAGLGYRYAEIDDASGSRTLTLVTVPLGATWDRRDNILNPTSGLYVKGDLTPFLGVNGSSSGARFFADARAYKGFGSTDRFVLAGRLQAGSVYGPEITEAAPDYLFYSGGGGTVRGQPYQSLDIDLGGGQHLGGRSFLGASAEIRAGITDKIGVVGFADFGYVGANPTPDDTGGWHSGAGLGLRYNTGIGPIRFDIATPTSGSDAGEKVHFYIGIGQAF